MEYCQLIGCSLICYLDPLTNLNNNFSNNFSLFQLEKTHAFYKHVDHSMVSIQNIFFGEKGIKRPLKEIHYKRFAQK